MRISTSSKVLITLLTTTANAHSWIEQLTVIGANGTFVGDPGYPRGYVPRTSPDFSDTDMTHRLPANGNELTKQDMMCMDSQQQQKQKDSSTPRLQAQQGSAIALRYQENGHVTLPETQKGKPENRGTIYVYGTTDPKSDEKILDIHKVWNKDGTGGDKRGRLLSKQDYDDHQCYQVNGGEISKTRQTKFAHQADQLMGADLWCQQDIALPDDAPSGKPYTLYWVWDWPTLPGKDPSLPDGKQELYTTCMDVDIIGKANTKTLAQAKFDEGQSLNGASLQYQFEEIFNPGSGSGSQGAASPAVAQSSAVPASSSVGVSSVGVSSVAAPSIQLSSSSPVRSASSVVAASPTVPSVNQFNSPYRPTSSSAIAAGPSSAPAMLAAPSASSSILNKYQQTGPSFVTRTRSVHQTHCPDA